MAKQMKRKSIRQQTKNAIRKDYAKGKLTLSAIARKYSVASSTVSLLVRTGAPLDVKWAYKRYKTGERFRQIARQDAILNKRSKPLTAKSIEAAVLQYESDRRNGG